MRAANIPPFSNMTPNAKVLSGSTGAKLYKNATDKKWVIKKSEKGLGGFEQVKTESIVDDIYQALGIPVPKHILDIPNKALILEYIDGKSLADATPDEYEKAKKELQKGFIVDALLANWDVIGLLEDNILLPTDDSPAVRIDNGGSLTFRAQGGKKPFNKVVTEIDTMRNKTISPQAAKIFGDLTDTDIDTQIKTIIVPNYELILSLTPDELKEAMKARMDNLIERTVWTNASAFKNTIEETSEPEYIPAVQAALIKYFKAGWLKHLAVGWFKVKGEGNSDEQCLAFINKTLKDNGAVVSGGFILKAIGSFVDEKSVDIDLYVPTAHAEDFRNIMTKLFDSSVVVKHVLSDSPGSFFKKNGIVSVSKYSKTEPKYAEMDIIEVNEDRTPIDVVKNFDLTFCENWYDGENVWMTYPEHVKTKAGFLENHYLNILFTGNPVLIGRMKKYIRRGFKISINNPVTKKAENISNGISNGTLFQQQIQNLSKAAPKDTHYGSYGSYGTEIKYPLLSEISLNDIDNSIIHISPLKNATLNINMSPSAHTNYPNTPLSNFSTNFSSLTQVNIEAIRHYTGTGYKLVNEFLYTDRRSYPDYSLISKRIGDKFPRNMGEAPTQYYNRLIYYYFVNLYNGIQKAPHISYKPVKLYRGTKTWYLEEDKGQFSYINSFCSTTITQRTALSFGFGYYSNGINKIYEFYVHPNCGYINAKPISLHQKENEIILNPYNRYIYINENEDDRANIIYKRYIILPSDLDIPTTYSTFMSWKKEIVARTKIVENNRDEPPNYGGRLKVKVQNPEVSGRYKVRDTTLKQKMKSRQTPIKVKQKVRFRTLKMKPNKANISKKILPSEAPTITKPDSANTSKKPVYDENTIHRFTDPLPSFPGKVPTKAEMEVIEKMMAFFKNDKE